MDKNTPDEIQYTNMIKEKNKKEKGLPINIGSNTVFEAAAGFSTDLQEDIVAIQSIKTNKGKAPCDFNPDRQTSNNHVHWNSNMKKGFSKISNNTLTMDNA